MILTEKGSTRGTVSILLLAALIFLGSRFAVNFIEDSFPPPPGPSIEWHPVKDILKNNDEAFDEQVSPDKSEKKGKSITRGPLVTPESIRSDEINQAHEEAEKSEKDVVGKSTTEDGATKKSFSEKKAPRKRFAVERVFPGNVDQRPLLFFFADDGSVLSKKMERTSLGIADVRNKIKKDFYPVKINFDKNLSKTEYKLYRNFGSAAAPLLSIRSSTGESLAFSTGYLSAVKVMVLLNNALETQKKLEEGEGTEDN